MSFDQFWHDLDMQNHTLVDRDRCALIYESVVATSHLDGDLAELGVYRGGTAKLIHAARPARLLHLFDTFTGIPIDDSFPDGHVVGEMACDVSTVKSYMGGGRFAWHVGFFPDTTAGLSDVQFSFVHVDCDIYQSVVASIEYFWPRMVPTGIMVFDDYGHYKCQGVKAALDSFFGDKVIPSPFRHVPSSQLQAKVIK